MSQIYSMTIQNLTAPQAVLGSVSMASASFGSVQGSLSVAGDITLTGNLRQAYANAPAGGPADYTFGNLTAANLSVAGIGNVKTLAAGTIFCSNIVGYSSGTPANLSLNALSANVITSNALTVAGNLGIMTANPQYTLDVNGSVRANGAIYQQALQPAFLLGNSTALNQAAYVNYNGSGSPGSLGLGVFGATQSITVGPSGNVGVFATSPAYPLDVTGIIRSSGAIVTGQLGLTGSNQMNFASDKTTSDTAAGTISYQKYSTALDVVGAGVSPTRLTRMWDWLGIGLTPSYGLDVYSTMRFGTAGPGDGSIGTTASIVNRVQNVSYVLPNQPVAITASVSTTQSYVNTDYNYPNQGGSFPGGRLIVNDSSNGTDWRWQSKVQGNQNNGLVERMTIAGTGYVGINQPTPSYTLDVNGGVRSSGPVVLGSSAANTAIVTMMHPTGNVGMFFEPGNLTGGGGVGWQAINFNGYYNNGEVVVNPSRSRWRIVADQRTMPDGFFIDQITAGGSSFGYLRLASGNVGICQPNPQTSLDVGGNVRASSYTFTQGQQSIATGNGYPYVMNFQYFTGGYAHAIRTRHNNASTPSNGNSIDMYTWQASDGVYGSPNNIAMSVTSAGVGINNTPYPAYQLHTQPTATDVHATNPDATNTLLVFEDCRGSTVAAGTLSGSATFVSNSYIQLTPSAQNQTGGLNYYINPGTAFDVTFEHLISGSADTTSFYVYCSSPVTISRGGASAYQVTFDEYAGGITTYWNGTQLAFYPFSFPGNTWTQVRMTFVRNLWRVWYGATQVVNYQDVSRTLVGSATYNMGFVSQTGYATAAHQIRSIYINKFTAGYWRPATGGNVAGISYNGNVGINAPSPGYTLDVNGYMRTNNRNVAFKYTYTGSSSTSFSGSNEVQWNVVDGNLPYQTLGTGRFVAPVAGLYHFTFNWGVGGNTTSNVYNRVFMSRNTSQLSSPPDPTASGSPVFAATENCQPASQSLLQSCSAPVICAVGDVIQCWFSVSAGSVTVYSWINRLACAYLAGHLISAN